MSLKCPGKFPGNCPQMSRKFRGFFPEMSRNFPGFFPEMSRKCPGSSRKLSGKLSGHVLRCPGNVREEESGNALGAFREHSGNSQNVQKNSSWTCPGHCLDISRKVSGSGKCLGMSGKNPGRVRQMSRKLPNVSGKFPGSSWIVSGNKSGKIPGNVREHSEKFPDCPWKFHEKSGKN